MGRITIALGASLLSVAVARAEVASEDRLIIDVIAANGFGCSGVAITVHRDQRGFDVVYPSLTAMVGVGAGPLDPRKTCQLTLLVRGPSGVNIDVDRAELRGFTSLAAGASGQVQSSFAVDGSPPLTFAAHAFSGPVDEDWMFGESYSHPAVVLPCRPSRKLVVTTEVRVAPGTSDPTTTTSFIVVDDGFGSGGSSFLVSFPFCG